MSLKQFIGSGDTGIIGAINVVIVPVIFALAFMVFVYGVVKYFFFKGEAAELQAGRQFMLWGILGLVVLFSIWGIINILLSTLGIVPT